MSFAMKSVCRRKSGAKVFVFLVFALSLGIRATAQSAGNKVVEGASVVTASTAYIDASALKSGDICQTLNAILNTVSTTNGAVIDARGINPGGTQSCSINPWKSPAPSTGWSPATVLLPSGVITISTTWILPNETKIVGEGPGVTVLSAAKGFVPDVDGVNAMMEMGSIYSSNTTTYDFCGGGTTKPADCVSVGVRDLTLDASSYTGNTTIIGVANQGSQELSVVDHVAFNDSPTGTQTNGMLGLSVYSSVVTGGPACLGTPASGASCSSNNSGPYSNLIFTAGAKAGAGTQCAAITGETGIRGIHGMTCTAAGTAPAAGIKLDSNSTSIEDVFVNGFQDGILVGANDLATQGDVLLNITGGSSIVKNVIHISNVASAGKGSSNCPSNSNTTEDVCDLTILHVTAAAGNSIQDDITCPASCNSGSVVGMYVLGEEVGTAADAGQYSRFTTSPSYPSWGVGTTNANGESCVSNGSLYTNLSASTPTGNGTLFACVTGTWQIVK